MCNTIFENSREISHAVEISDYETGFYIPHIIDAYPDIDTNDAHQAEFCTFDEWLEPADEYVEGDNYA